MGYVAERGEDFKERLESLGKQVQCEIIKNRKHAFDRLRELRAFDGGKGAQIERMETNHARGKWDPSLLLSGILSRPNVTIVPSFL